MKQAVCVIICSPSRYFAVSRRNDPTQWGFPGGKVDPGESHCEAAVRETMEEIGFEMKPDELIPVYSGKCEGKIDGVNYWVATYLYTHTVNEEDFLSKVKLEEGLTGAFATGDELVSASFSPFNFYNDLALESLDAFLM